jgi:uncharacterized membrane protein YcgQ (UPF0703/DUF1980 family)
MRRRIFAIIVILFGAYIVKIVLTGGIRLYINTNNIWYTGIAGAACCCIGGIDLFVSLLRQQTGPVQKQKLFDLLLYSPLVLALLVGFLLPPKTIIFTPGNFYPMKPPPYSGTPVADGVIARLLGFDTQQYSFAKWYLTESLSPDYHYQDGKPIDLTGEIMTVNPAGHSFYFGELYIICCVVDARPFGYTVHYLASQNGINAYAPNEWVHIQGSFFITMAGKQKELDILAFQAQIVPQPKEPYIN